LTIESAYQMFSFPKQTLLLLQKGETLANAWRLALKSDGIVPEEVCLLLLPLGEELGASDLDGQVETIAQYRSLLESKTKEIGMQAQNLQKLYFRLGILGGLMAVILLA